MLFWSAAKETLGGSWLSRSPTFALPIQERYHQSCWLVLSNCTPALMNAIVPLTPSTPCIYVYSAVNVLQTPNREKLGESPAEEN